MLIRANTYRVLIVVSYCSSHRESAIHLSNPFADSNGKLLRRLSVSLVLIWLLKFFHVCLDSHSGLVSWIITLLRSGFTVPKPGIFSSLDQEGNETGRRV